MNMRKNGIGPRTNLAKPAIAALLALTLASGAAAQCPPDPPPIGPNISPANAFSPSEYAFVNSSTNLQSQPAYTKTAAGLFWNPLGSFGTGINRAFGAFSSAVIVNNPDPLNPTVVTIDYRDPSGNPLGTSGPITIPPDGTHMEDASIIGLSGSGIGSAIISVVDPKQNGPIVGTTLHYFDSIGVPGWGVARDPDSTVIPPGFPLPAPGEGSYQQLQETPLQYPGWEGWHLAGPFRFTNSSVSDFDNGSAPVLMVANPNDHAVDVAFVTLVVGPNGPIANLGSTIQTLAPRGMTMETSLWTGLNQLTSGFAGFYDFDILVAVLALDGSPLVGDALVIDAFGNNEGLNQNRNLNLGRRLRMVSMSIAGAPGITYNGPLYASDVSTFTPPGAVTPMIRTGMKVANGGFTNIGTVTIDYFDHDGTHLVSDSVSNLPPGGTIRIGRGEAQTPNFPVNMWNGSVRVSAGCAGERLIGWTAREIERYSSPTNPIQQHLKAYGEEMTGANGREPGPFGLLYQLPDQTIVSRRVASIVRTKTTGVPNFQSGYTSFTYGYGTQNTGPYVYRFLRPNGLDVTNYNPQPFAGLHFGATSLTYEDSDPNPVGRLNSANGLSSGRVDFLEPLNFAHGINALGDSFTTLQIGQFARRNLGPAQEDDAWEFGDGIFEGGPASDRSDTKGEATATD